uniref:Protein kinase domain-containing protein n=1 Tax=Kalanchoe fedtschenkoi TaxID=63787 RepID=A0A7N1A566_KALFE
MWIVGYYLTICGSVVGCLLAVLAVYFVIHWQLKKQDSLKDPDLEMRKLSLSIRTTSEKKISFDGSQSTFDGLNIRDKTPRKMLVEIYASEEIRRATDDFNRANLIGGAVYHSRLNGREVAIKISDRETHSNIEFELFSDTTHCHPNILRLLGTCLGDGSEAFLVFEFARNGTLKDWLHGGLVLKNQFIASCYCSLTWSQRLKICLHVAKALKYMHHAMIPSYVHRNVKSRNIFLDEDFKAKLGNFGMARCAKEDDEEADFETESCSSRAASWAKGYLAPEGAASRETDIFAYGVVLLEVLSAQAPVSEGSESVSLADKVKSILKSGKAEEALREWIDRALGDDYPFPEALKLAELARACTEEDPSSRPTAIEIVDKLSVLVRGSPEEERSPLSESSSKPLAKSAAIRP